MGSMMGYRLPSCKSCGKPPTAAVSGFGGIARSRLWLTFTEELLASVHFPKGGHRKPRPRGAPQLAITRWVLALRSCATMQSSTTRVISSDANQSPGAMQPPHFVRAPRALRVSSDRC
jgi:hypothetical protein